MIIEIEEYLKYVLIVGMKNFKVASYNEIYDRIGKINSNLKIQFIDSSKILDSSHIYFATKNALKAFKNKRNISKNLVIEILLYLAGKKQIDEVIGVFGINKEIKNPIMIAVADKKEDLEKLEHNIKNSLGIDFDDSIIEIDSKNKIEIIKNVFNITDLEIEAIKRKGETYRNIIKKLIIERIALLYAGIRI